MSFSQAGTYVLRLNGINTTFSASDDMVVFAYDYTGLNQAPAVRAQPIERVLVGQSTVLTGTVLDDGLVWANPAISWSQLAGAAGGPARVAPAAPSTLTTPVGPFPAAGRYIYELSVTDGELSASERVSVTVCNGEPGPVDVVLVMDNSGSMVTYDNGAAYQRFVRSRTAAQTFLDFINQAADQVAVVHFADTAALDSELSSNPEIARETIARLPRISLGAGTQMDTGLYAALNELISTRHRPGSLPAVVLLSDGYPNDPRAARFAANQLRNSGVRIITIGLVPANEDQAPVEFLRSISSSDEDAYVGVTEAELSHIYASIAESFCLGQNHRPLVGIEGDTTIEINMGDPLVLRASANDDLTPSQSLAVSWTLQHAYNPCDDTTYTDRSVTFAPVDSLMPSVVFPSGPGAYRLRLTVTDSSGSSSFDEVTVIVNDVPVVTPCSGQTLNWAGIEIPVTLSGTVVNTISAPGEDIVGQLYPCRFWGAETKWSLVAGPFSTFSIHNETALEATAEFRGPGRYVLRLASEDGYASSSADVIFNILPENSVEAGANKTGSVGVPVSLGDSSANPQTGGTFAWTKRAGPGTTSFSNPNSLNPTVTINVSGSYILRLTGTFGAKTVYDELTVRIGSAGVEAGNDITIAQGGTASLSGTAVNSAGSPLATTWSVADAPSGGLVTFADPASKTTTATLSLPGTYRLRLTATDGSADDLMVYVNQPPGVEAGPDQSVSMQEPVLLRGAITSDDFMPPNALTTVTWSKLSGPGQAMFTDATSLQTYVRFEAEGTYVLKLEVKDSHLTGQDTVTLRAYIPPVAHADAFLIEEGNEPFVLDVLRNDWDPEGGSLAIADLFLVADSLGTRTAGTVTPINNNSQLVFVPDPGTRETGFWYSIREPHGGVSDYAFVKLRIVPPPHAPQARPDAIYTSVNAVNQSFDVVFNDDDGGYPPLVIISYGNLQGSGGTPGRGTIGLIGERIVDDTDHPFFPQRLQYTGDGVNSGVFTFTYTVRNQKGATSTSVVTLVVEPAANPDSAPVVDAGEDVFIYVSDALTLAGSVTDDGWATQSWSSNPSAGVNFDDPSALNPTVVFPAPGDYALTLTAEDGVNTPVLDNITVHVLPEARKAIGEIFNLVNDPKRLQPDPVITEGLFKLRGRAIDPDPAKVVKYRIGLYKPATTLDSPPAFVAWVTPGGDASGKVTRRVNGDSSDDVLG
ncbi:MAG TPA: VWA domain-containing protein, partial [Clostridia bacterium]|nr:VWA domain-containing protein [Clostridia bacterium]